jgi:hypothetical protein
VKRCPPLSDNQAAQLGTAVDRLPPGLRSQFERDVAVELAGCEHPGDREFGQVLRRVLHAYGQS